MKIFFYIAAFLISSSALQASEDVDPFAFGDFEQGGEETGAINEDAPQQAEWDNLSDTAQGVMYEQPAEEKNVTGVQTAPFVPAAPKTDSENAADNKKINPDQSLTESFQPEEKKSALPIKVEGTWVDKLKNTNPLAPLKNVTSQSDVGDNGNISLEGMVKSRRKGKKRRSNASVFDISGLMLRMKVPQIEEIMQNRGFRKMYEKLEIPNFIRWRNEEKCRNDGVIGYERLDACVVERAKKDNHQYVDTIKFSKFDSQEEIEVRFTSNFTENKAYKITYKSLTPRIIGNSPKAMYLRNIKIYDFWKKINQKYGAPDNKDEITWGLGGNKPFLKANTGFLNLEDPMFRELDYTRMSREDQRFINSDFYNF